MWAAVADFKTIVVAEAVFITADVVKALAENDKAVSALIMSAFVKAGKLISVGPSKVNVPVTVAIAPNVKASLVNVEAADNVANVGKEISSAVIIVAPDAVKAAALNFPALIVRLPAVVAANVTSAVAVIVAAPVTLVA